MTNFGSSASEQTVYLYSEGGRVFLVSDVQELVDKISRGLMAHAARLNGKTGRNICRALKSTCVPTNDCGSVDELASILGIINVVKYTRG